MSRSRKKPEGGARDTALPSDGGPSGGRLAYATVATTGAAVMMLEVLGTRVIAPFYGVGLFVWTALISVALIALAAGYQMGGRLADRRPSSRLSIVIGGAAVLTALIPLVRSFVLRLTDPLGLRLGSLAAALLLFGGPLTLLGMVGPHVMRRRTDRLDLVGTTAGSVLAVSTCGSVAGTLLVGFVLLPSFGTRSILLGLSLSLLLLAGIVWWHEAPRSSAAAGTVVAAAVAAFLLTAAAGGATGNARFQVQSDTESLYGRVRVVDDTQGGLRWMLVDASAIGARFLGTDDVALPYLYALESLPEIRRDARSALVIGLGQGYLPWVFAREGLAVDTVEIDPAVADAARTYFGFVPPGALIVGDARYEIRRLTRRYDVIVHDCFTGGEMPWHLFSREMLQTLRERLQPGGLLALNFFGLKEQGPVDALSAVAATLDAVFPHRLTLAPSAGHELFDRLFLVSDRAIELPAGPPTRTLTAGGQEAFDRLSQMVTALSAAPDAVITDDHNPLESLQLRKAEAYRRLVLAGFGADLLAQ